jgi:signal transduction histidine kinase
MLGQVEVATDDVGAEAVRAMCVAVATLPIAWRSRAPLAVTVAVATSWVIFHVWGGFVGEPYFEITALLVIYSLGAQPVLKRAAGGLAILLVAVAVTDIRDLGFFGMLFALVWLSSRGVQTYRFQATQLRASALELRRGREAAERLAVAQERQRIAVELHDTIADAVSIMVVQAGGAEQLVSDEPDRARAALAAVQDTGRAVIAEFRQVLRLLRTSPKTPGSDFDSPVLVPAPAWWGRRPVLRSIWADVVLALFVGLLADPQMTHLDLGSGIPLPVAASSVVAFVTVVIRRWVPLAALVIATTTSVVELLLFGTAAGFASVVAMLLAMYSMAAHTATRRSVPAAVAVVVALSVVMMMKVGADGATILVVWLGIPWFGGRRVRTYQRRADQLRVLTVQLAHERDARARLAVLEERARVARELHDSLAHAITVMVLQAGAAEQVLTSSPDRAREAIRAIESHGRQAHDDLCHLLGLFDSDARGFHGPQPSLTRLDALFAEAGVPVTLKVSGWPARLSVGLDISAYRIVQEGLTNTLKHVGPVATTVTLDYQDEALAIEIRNQGNGRPAQTTGQGGHGLLGMRERATLYGGSLETDRGPDGGFVVRALLPFTTPVT